MKGIIYKDFLIALLPKNISSCFMNVLVMIPIIWFFRNTYGLALSCVLLAPMCGTSLLQMSLEQDELSKFDKFQLTFPLTKKQIILSKYMGGLLFMSFFIVLSFLIAMFYYGVFQVTDLSTCLQIWVFGIIVGLIFFSVAYVGFFALGNKKGLVVYFILMIIAALAYIFGFFNFDAMTIMQMNYNLLLAIGLAIAIVFLMMSYLLSLKIYTRRYS